MEPDLQFLVLFAVILLGPAVFTRLGLPGLVGLLLGGFVIGPHGLGLISAGHETVPALGHRRVSAGESWASLAGELLGDTHRSDVLAAANGSMPWLAPADGQEIIAPYNLRVLAGQHDSLLTIAYRYLGSRDKAWAGDALLSRTDETSKNRVQTARHRPLRATLHAHQSEALDPLDLRRARQGSPPSGPKLCARARALSFTAASLW